MRELWRRLRYGRLRERGLDEEIRFHIDQQTEKHVRAGLTAAEARRLAFVKFGGVEYLKERTRDEYRPALVEDFLRDVRYGVRLLFRSKSYASVAILTLSLGIGAATAVFSVVDGVLLRPLPYPDPDRIVRLFQVDGTGRRNNMVSEPNFEDWKTGTRSFSAMAEMQSGSVPVSIGGEATMTAGAAVSREFFDVMGVRPLVGRGFVPEEQRVGGSPAVIVSDRLWRGRLGGAPLDTLALRIESTVHPVIGVMPPGFDYPGTSEFWTARELSPPQRSRTGHNFRIVARVSSAVAVSAAQSEISILSRTLKTRYGDGTWMSDAAVVPLRESLTAASRPVLLLLFGAAILLLAIACLNVSNLHLARASTRHRELALRLAVGADRGRLTRQLLAEALVLAVAASVLGVAIAFAGVRALAALQPANVPRIADVRVDGGVLSFALAVAVGTAVLLALLTSVRTSSSRLRESLGEGQRTMGGGRGERARQSLVVAQVALTMVLLLGAGLLARSFIQVLAVDPGYSTADALVLDLTWMFSREPQAQARRRETQREILTRLGRLPGVDRAGLVSSFPLGSGNYPNGRFIEMTRPDEISSQADVETLGNAAKVRIGMADYRIASEGYFAAMGIPLIRGRLFEPSDGPDAPHVAVISESLAKTKWPGQDPLGRFVQFGNMDGDLRGFRIVGVVGDVREISLEAQPGSTFYGYYQQRPTSRVSVVVKAASPAALTTPARQIVQALDTDVPLQVRTVEDAFDRALAGRRFSLLLIGVFSVCALVLATLGVYGLMAYLVSQRTREIGIRLALGAESTDVVALVVGRGVRLAVVGVAIGSLAALGLTGLLDGMLFGVTATDPIAFVSVMALTLTAVVAATWVPARRALKVAPIVALRAD
jgi:putative ABC transport system permease protein